MKKRAEISIIVPAFNEERNIPLLIEKTEKMIENAKLDCELIIVDDGSTDGTYNEASKYQKRYNFIKVLKHRKNRGITDALISGFGVAEGDIYLFFPADLQYDPEDIPKLIEPIYDGADIVTGWKKGRYERRFISNVYNALSRWLFKVPVHDLNSVKAFKKEVVENLPLRRDWHRYMVALAYEEGYKIEEVRVNLYPRKYGKSKLGFWRIPVGALDLIAVKFQTAFVKKPMLLFGSAGSISLLSGLIVGLVALYLRIFKGVGFRPLLNLILLLVLAGFSLFALGFLGESIATLFQEIKRLEDRLKEKRK